MDVFDPGPRKVLSLFLDSTARKFYGLQIEQRTGLTRKTVYVTLRRLFVCGYLIKHQESHSTTGKPRTYYSITPTAVSICRLEKRGAA